MRNTPPLTLDECYLVAAVLGGTNLGLPNPTRKEVERIRNLTGLFTMVRSLWSPHMETEEMENAFYTECHAQCNWLIQKHTTADGVRKIWPDIADLVFGKPENSK